MADTPLCRRGGRPPHLERLSLLCDPRRKAGRLSPSRTGALHASSPRFSRWPGRNVPARTRERQHHRWWGHVKLWGRGPALKKHSWSTPATEPVPAGLPAAPLPPRAAWPAGVPVSPCVLLGSQRPPPPPRVGLGQTRPGRLGSSTCGNRGPSGSHETSRLAVQSPRECSRLSCHESFVQ